MRILAAADSIFRMATEHVPWSPTPEPGHYPDDMEWQRAHLWDHHTETGNTHGAFSGPTILHHPDLNYALDNGWRVVGGDKAIDHQRRGESGSGSDYLYKASKDGLMHQVHLSTGPEETHLFDDEDGEGGRPTFEEAYGSVPAENWRHLIMGEGSMAENPVSHDTLRDLVDDELDRSSRRNGYSDFKVMPGLSVGGHNDDDWVKRLHHATRRAWETGTNDPSKHWEDPIPDYSAEIDNIPRGRRTPKPNPYEDHEY